MNRHMGRHYLDWWSSAGGATVPYNSSRPYVPQISRHWGALTHPGQKLYSLDFTLYFYHLLVII